jgi:predicted RNA-binding protein with PUA-like domain
MATRSRRAAATARTAAPTRGAEGDRFWLVKTEPEVYSIDDLARDRRTGWDGVRNHQARNFMRDSMQVGDLVLVYHSNADPPGVAGLARVSGAARPDPTAFDPNDPHFDPRSKRDAPTWLMVELEFVERFPALLPLDRLRRERALEGMPLLARGQRLSVQPVSPVQFKRVLALARG